MKAAGKPKARARGKLISLAIVLLAVALAVLAAYESDTRPTTSDSTIDADVVHVAAAVGGRVIQIAVAENMRVAGGAYSRRTAVPTNAPARRSARACSAWDRG